MLKKAVIAILVVTSTLSITVARTSHSELPKNGVVPNEQTAIEIAEAVLKPVYGEDVVSGQRPFQARLYKGVWTVFGALSPNRRGGALLVEIQRSDGKILELHASL